MRVAAVISLGLLSAAPGAAAETPIFSERAAEARLEFVHFNGMSGRFYFPEVVGSGAALFDADADGDLDIYLVQGAMLGPESPDTAIYPPKGSPGDRLFRNDLEIGPGGERRLRFTDVTEAAGIEALGYGMGVATGDADGDGRIDLYVTNFGANQLWRNLGPDARGQVRFEDVTAAAGVEERRWSVPAVFFDADGDGLQDLYVGNYVSFQLALNKSCVGESGLRDYCGPQSYDPEPDRLWHNLGPGPDGRPRFEDWSERAGLAKVRAPALGALAADLDGSGLTDLYVANDQAANHLWLNRGEGRFVEDALLLGCALNRDGEAEASMGVDAADLDQDGDEDLFMTHLSRESNTLYVNDGRGLFRDRSLESGLANPSWRYTGFGTAFFDYDNDGWLDLLAVNGAVYLQFDQRGRGDPYPLRQPNQLFRNVGGKDGPRFIEVTERAGAVFELSEVSRGAAFGDVDNDGDTDVVVVNNSGPVRLLVNEVGQRNRWLGLRLVEGEPARDAVGARVKVLRRGAPPLWRRSRTDGSYASSNDPRVLVGLGSGAGAEVEAVEVHWLGGEVERFTDLEIDAYQTLRRGSGTSVPRPAPPDR